jgi:hypothetical protein
MFTMIFFRNHFLSTFVKLGPPRFRRFLVDLLPFKNARRLRDIVDIVHNTSIEILEAKRRALQEGNEAVVKQIGQGKDIISILSVWDKLSRDLPAHQPILSVKANMAASDEDKLPESEVLAQVVSYPRSSLFLLMHS